MPLLETDKVQCSRVVMLRLLAIERYLNEPDVGETMYGRPAL
jgi:hypothetical protein